MLTSVGASTVSGATLRYVRTSYCGSCIKVLRKDWGKGTKKVKPFAYTPETGLIKLSGLIYLWAGCSLAETTSLQTGSTKHELGTIAGGRLNPLCHTPSPTTDRLCVSTEMQSFRPAPPAPTGEVFSTRKVFPLACHWGVSGYLCSLHCNYLLFLKGN